MTYVEPIRGNPITPRNRINLYYHSGGGRAKPISNAMFYYGEIDKDPIDDPIRITTKDEHDVHRVLSQPIHTNASGHFIDEAGYPIEIFTDQLENSILIKDKNGEIIYGPLNEYDNFDIVPYLEKVGTLVSLTHQDLKDGLTLGGEKVGHKPGQMWHYLGLNNPLDGLGNYGVVKEGAIVENPPHTTDLGNGLYIEMNRRSLDQISTTLDNVKLGKNVDGESVPFTEGQLWHFLGETDPYHDDGGWGIVNKGTATLHPDNPPSIVRLDTSYYLKTNKQPPLPNQVPPQFETYDSSRIYKTGEVCGIINNDQVEYYQWYSNIEHKAAVDPLDPANRFIGWTDASKPWYWIPYVGAITGSEVFSYSLQLEFAVRLIGQDLAAVQYWRLAKLLGVSVDDFNLGDVLNRFLRVSNNSVNKPGKTLQDAVQKEAIPLISGGGGTVRASGQVLSLYSGGSVFGPPGYGSSGPFRSSGNIHRTSANSNTAGGARYANRIDFSLNAAAGGATVTPQANARYDDETRPVSIYRHLHVVF